jgi:WD40 repeat protein
MRVKREPRLSHVSHKYTVHNNDFEIFSAKFSTDNVYLAASFADGQLSIYSSMLGDDIYNIRDPEAHWALEFRSLIF